MTVACMLFIKANIAQFAGVIHGVEGDVHG